MSITLDHVLCVPAGPAKEVLVVSCDISQADGNSSISVPIPLAVYSDPTLVILPLSTVTYSSAILMAQVGEFGLPYPILPDCEDAAWDWMTDGIGTFPGQTLRQAQMPKIVYGSTLDYYIALSGTSGTFTARLCFTAFCYVKPVIPVSMQ